MSFKESPNNPDNHGKNHDKKNKHLISEREVLAILARALNYEYCRQVQEGLDCLKPLWENFTERPLTGDFSPAVKGEILLRCASVLSYYSHYKQIPNQTTARNWMRESLNIFTDLDISDKVAEVETEMAMTYWRECAYQESLQWLESASSKVTNDLNSVNIKNISYQILANFSINTPESIRRGLEIIETKEVNVQLSLDKRVKVLYYNNSALLMTRANLLTEAEIRHQKCIHFCKEINNQITLAHAENNVGYILKQFKQFDQALKHTHRALEVFQQMNATACLGDCYDTLAQIYLEQQIFLKGTKFDDALYHADKSLEILTAIGLSEDGYRTPVKGEDCAPLINALRTKSLILIHKRDVSQAILVMAEIYRIAEHHRGVEAAKNYTADLHRMLHLTVNNSFEEEVSGFEKVLLANALGAAEGDIYAAAETLSLSEEKLSDLLFKHPDLIGRFNLRLEPPCGSADVDAGSEAVASLPDTLLAAETKLIKYDCNSFPVLIPQSVDVRVFMSISEPRLAAVGLIEGRVAVVAFPCEEYQHLPTVLCELSSARYHYGYRSDAFGMIGLESDDTSFAPQAFAPEKVEVIGNIIGYCKFDFDNKTYTFHFLNSRFQNSTPTLLQ